jgi:hypothetical protein
VPGSFFTFVCPSCSTRHEMTTGGSYDRSKDEFWGYSQYVCATCQTLRSVADREVRDDPIRCERCGAGLAPWSGRVWFDRDDKGNTASERVEGPCPRCEALITLEHAEELGLWD